MSFGAYLVTNHRDALLWGFALLAVAALALFIYLDEQANKSRLGK